MSVKGQEADDLPSEPHQEQSNEALTERARSMGVDAAVRITYDFGVGLTTWGYTDCKVAAVRLLP